jgi:anti-anti-sigma regulatory factor
MPATSTSSAEAPASVPPSLRFIVVRGVPLARLLGPRLTEEPDIERLGNALSEAIACGNDRLILDFRDVNRVSRKLLAVIARAHRSITEAGGALKITSLRPELTRFLAQTRLPRRLDIVPDVKSAVEGEWTTRRSARRQDGQGTRPGRSSSKRRRPAQTIDAMAYGCLKRSRPGPDSAESDAALPVLTPKQQAALTSRATLICHVHLGIHVVEPRPPRLEGEIAVVPLLQAMGAVQELAGPRRLVIDMSQVVIISDRSLALLAIQALNLVKARGELRLSHVRPCILHAVNDSRLVHFAKIYATLDEAVLDPWR